MTSDHRITPGLITDVLDALERHGYAQGDDLHAGPAIGLIGDLACIYDGTQDYPATAYPIAMPLSPPAYPGPSRHHAVTLTRADAGTMFAALDIAADDKRYRVEMCPTAPTSPALTARPTSRTPGPSTRWPITCSRPPRQPPLSAPASPGQIASPSPPPTGRPASDALPPETGQASHRPGCHAPDP